MYSLINNPNIYPTCTKPIDRMGQIQTTYLLCIRIAPETTALRVISSAPYYSRDYRSSNHLATHLLCTRITLETPALRAISPLTRITTYGATARKGAKHSPLASALANTKLTKVIRRAVVSRVIRVQRRYAVQI